MEGSVPPMGTGHFVSFLVPEVPGSFCIVIVDDVVGLWECSRTWLGSCRWNR